MVSMGAVCAASGLRVNNTHLRLCVRTLCQYFKLTKKAHTYIHILNMFNAATSEPKIGKVKHTHTRIYIHIYITSLRRTSTGKTNSVRLCEPRGFPGQTQVKWILNFIWCARGWRVVYSCVFMCFLLHCARLFSCVCCCASTLHQL